METIDDTTYLTGDEVREFFRENGAGEHLAFELNGSAWQPVAGDVDNYVRVPHAYYGYGAEPIHTTNYDVVGEDYPFIGSVSTGMGSERAFLVVEGPWNVREQVEQVLELLSFLEANVILDDDRLAQENDRLLAEGWEREVEDCEACGETPKLREDDYGMEFYMEAEHAYFSNKAIQHAWQDHNKVCKG